MRKRVRNIFIGNTRIRYWENSIRTLSDPNLGGNETNDIITGSTNKITNRADDIEELKRSGNE